MATEVATETAKEMKCTKFHINTKDLSQAMTERNEIH